MNQELLKMQSALTTLEGLGFTWEGGEQWKPPLGKAPYYLRDVPKYVTADLSNDTMCLIGDRLTHDKDYKVLNIYKDRFLVKDDSGNENWYHNSWFYSEDNDSVEVIEESFDDLVYLEPEIPPSNYIVLRLSQLSECQLKYLSEFFDTDERWYGDIWDVVMVEKGCSDIWKNKLSYITGDKTDLHFYTFNDIFKHKDEI